MTEARSSQARRTDPRGFVLKAIEGLKSAILPVAVLVFTRVDDGVQAVLLVSLVAGGGLLLVSLLVAYLNWTRLTYRVDASDIRVESGLLSRQARSVPFERIQDVAMTQGPLARLFGLVELTFDTGAGAGEDISLAYLREAEAERLRAVVRDFRREAAMAEAPVEESGDTSRFLFGMTPGRVLILGIFNFSLVAIAAAGGFLAQYDDFLPFDLWDLEGWRERLAGPGAWLAGLGVVAQAIGIAALILVLGIVGVATGIVRTALKQWNFRLERTDKGLRRRRGMFTKTDVTLPVRRVQAGIVAARMREKLFGWQNAGLVSLAADAGASNHDIAPLARWEEVRPLLEEAGIQPPHHLLSWHRVARAHAWLWAGWRLRWWIVLSLICFGAQRIVEPGGPLSLAWLPAVPLIIGLIKGLRTFFAIRATRYALDEVQLYVRSGWLSRRLELVPREKLHSVTIGSGPVGRRLGLASLSVGVAGTVVAIDGLPRDRAMHLREQLLSSMRRRDFSHLN